MATVLVTVATILTDGLLNPAQQTVVQADDAEFDNDGATVVRVQWTATPGTLTIFTPGTVDGLAIADRTIAMGANDDYFVGPFPKGIYDQANGRVKIDGDQQFTAKAFKLES